ncbi:MAG: exopolysaccharide Pel transporter PelG [Gammaproteobacteria bacterium]|jgi:uncharacterized membrane protein
MAGIGFELQKLMRRGTYTGVIRAYTYAGIISAGPWVISIFGILCLDFLKYFDIASAEAVQQFQVSVTYLIAVSLIFSSFLQHSFTRYVADRIFEKKLDFVVPNFNGALLIIIGSGGVLGVALVSWLFTAQGTYYQLLMVTTFVVLCSIWFATMLLSGLRNFKVIFYIFVLGYSLSIFMGYSFRASGLNGLLFGFFIGQFVLLVGMLFTIYYNYPSNRIIEFDFLRSGRMFITLVFTSLFYNVGIWADKFIFWFYPLNSHAVLGPLRVSAIYDLPIFLAYFAIIPGMAVFLFRVETNFAYYYDRYYSSIREGETLYSIIGTRYQMIDAARKSIFDIIRIQGITVFLVLLLAPAILSLLNISKYYVYLLNIDVVGTGLLVVFLVLINILFYLDRRLGVFSLTLLFAALNIVLTLITLHLGVFYFGYGFVMALLIADIVAIFILNRVFNQLEYITFMRK